METDSLFLFIAIAVATGSILLPLSVAAAIGYAKKSRGSGGGGSTATPTTTPTTPAPPASPHRGGSGLTRWVWRIFWILLIVGGGLFVADNFTYLKGQVEGLWGSMFNSAPSAPAPSVPAPTTPPIATPTPTTSPTPATGSSTGWFKENQKNLNLMYAIIAIAILIAIVTFCAWTKKKGFKTALGAFIFFAPILLFGYLVLQNEGDVNKTWRSITGSEASAASAPGTLPLADAVKPAYVLPCNGQVLTLRLKKGDIVRNANRCHTSYRVEYRDDTSPSQFWFRASSQPPVLMTPTSTACKMGHCPELNEFEAVTETATLKIIGCPAGRLVQGEFACR